jgi:hypothetical protein
MDRRLILIATAALLLAIVRPDQAAGAGPYLTIEVDDPPPAIRLQYYGRTWVPTRIGYQVRSRLAWLDFPPTDYEYDSKGGHALLRVAALTAAGSPAYIRVLPAGAGVERWNHVSLSGLPPYRAERLTPAPAAPKPPDAAALEALGIDPCLAPFAQHEGGAFRVPGYQATAGGRPLPARLSVVVASEATGAALGLDRLGVEVPTAGLRAEVLVDAGGELALPLLFAELAKQGLKPEQVEAAEVRLLPVLAAGEGRLHGPPAPISAGWKELAFPDRARLEWRTGAEPASILVTVERPAGLDAASWPVRAEVDAGAGGSWEAIGAAPVPGRPGAVRVSPADGGRPSRLRLGFGPGVVGEPLDLTADATWSAPPVVRPAVAGWELIPPAEGLPEGTAVRLTAAGGDEPVVLSRVEGPAATVLPLPPGLGWEAARGGHIEVRSPGRRPLLFDDVQAPRIDARAAAGAAGAKAPYLLGDRRPTVLIVYDAGPVGAADPAAENRVRQGQAEAARRLVERSRGSGTRLRTLARLRADSGNWPAGAAGSEFLDCDGQVPLTAARHEQGPETLERALRDGLVLRLGAGDLSDRLLVVAITPYRPAADDSGAARWLRRSAEQTAGAVDVLTIVVGVPPYVGDDDLLRRYVHPVRVATGPSADLAAEVRRATDAVLAHPSFGPRTDGHPFPEAAR